MKFPWLAAPILLLVGLACSFGPGSPLAGTSWTLSEMGAGSDLREVPATQPFTLEFLDADDELKGVTACNSYSGTYKIKDADFRVVEARITEVGCPTRELAELEDENTAILFAAQQATTAGSRLTINDGSGRTLVFDRMTQQQ